MADVVFTDQNFQQEVIGEQGMPVLVDFWAPWCGPCRIVGPIVEEIAKEYEGKVKVGKLNVDENPDVSSTYGIMSIPTLLLFKKGQPAKTLIGAQPKDVLKKAVDEILA
ncbi:MAG: thioredoxin [Patescibacteria group bacterium]|nr:thioredoxin [Patescibacteria group bacterium]